MTYTPLAAFTTLIYGILSVVGGAIGYKQAGSQISLISGLISGALLLIAAYLLFGGSSTGPTLAVVISIILIVVFAIRLVKTRKFMPAGLMILCGGINVVALLSLLSRV